MEDNADFYGPLQYSQGWMWAGFALLALVLGWYAFVFLSTRQHPAPEPRRPFTPPADLDGLKAAYLQRIDTLVADAAAGRLTAREAHQELSVLIRRFARDATGVDALRMTQAELHRHPLPAAAEAVGRMYPAEFGPEPLPPVTASAEAARQAVRLWS